MFCAASEKKEPFFVIKHCFESKESSSDLYGRKPGL